MIQDLAKKLFGSGNDRMIKRLRPVVEKINSFEAGLQALSQEQLASKTPEFKERHSKGETLNDL